MSHNEPNEFTCDMCGGTFERGWSDEEATQEAVANGFKHEIETGDTACVCEDCYQKLNARFHFHSTLGLQ